MNRHFSFYGLMPHRGDSGAGSIINMSLYTKKLQLASYLMVDPMFIDKNIFALGTKKKPLLLNMVHDD